MAISMKSIYKACVLTNKDVIERFVVFYGHSDNNNNNKTGEELGALFMTDPTNEAFMDPHTSQPIFSESELDAITKAKTRVIFSTQKIHLDDSISTIKHKINGELDQSLSMAEIYLFCVRSETHTPDGFYRALTQNKRTQLTRQRMHNALNNFNGVAGPATTIEEKETYLYTDVLKLGIFGKDEPVPTAHMLGQRLFLMDNHFPFSFNPFDDMMYDKLLASAAANALTTLNNSLLLDSGSIIDGTIYVCLASDVLAEGGTVRTSAQITDKYLLSIYFPLLVAQNIFTKEDIVARRVPIVNGSMSDVFAKEDMLHRIGQDTTMENQSFKWERRGISEFKIAIHQRFTLKVPLDVIFKLIPTSLVVPLTKLNPAGHRENMYRMYGETVSTDGRKIPHLTRPMVQYLMTNMGTTKSVSLYFAMEKGSFMSCDFEENGDIIAYGKFANPMSIEDVGDLIARHVNPVIKEVEPFFAQSGYQHNVFGTLYDKHVEVVHMQYTCIASTDADVSALSVQSIHNCITPAFIVESDDVGGTTGARMRYRKVSNFDKMTSKEAFVIEQLKRHDGYQGSALIQSIMSNYNMNDSDTRDLIARVGAELTVDNGIGVRTTKIRTNPGFLTVVSDVTQKGLRSTNRIAVSIDGIDNILYIDMIDDYVGAMLRLLLARDAVAARFPEMTAICAMSSEQTDMTQQQEDVLGAPDRGLLEQQELIIEDDEVKVGVEVVEPIGYGEPVEPVRAANAMDLLYGDGDDDSDDYDSDAENETGELSGGGPERNIVGMRVKKPTPFMTAMDAAEPELFLKAKTGKYERYSRTCDSAFGRQPMLLTRDEHAAMVEQERAGIIERYGTDAFYSLDAEAQAKVIWSESETDNRFTVSYGTSDENQFVYICPRYWCLKTNTFVHPKEMVTVIEDGKEVLRHPTCGGVIPRGQDKVKDDGNNVYEFTGDGRKGKDGKYAPQHPGFLEKDKHPKGYGIPCCFKLNVKNGEVLLSDKQNTRRKQCSPAWPFPTAPHVPSASIIHPDQKESGVEMETMDLTLSQQQEQEQGQFQNTNVVNRRRSDGNYIMDQNTSPIPPGRWAYMSIELQQFFKEYAVTYQVPSTPTQLRPNVQSLLRHGVESSRTQPFMACMADVMFFGAGSEPKSLAEFKQYLVDKLTIEMFAGLQNGNLVTTFYDAKRTTDADLAAVELAKLNMSADDVTTHIDSARKRMLAFQRFRAYLLSADAAIDYTYVWDLLCAPDIHASHPQGINLIILDIPETDTTTNVEIVCPSNHYSSQQFSSSRPSVIVVKKGDAYEPIYSYSRTDRTGAKGIEHSAYFQLTSSPSVMAALENIIKPLHNKRCGPLRSMNRTYGFQQPILLDKLVEVLRTANAKMPITIRKQVLNFSHKVIGLTVRFGETEGFIPCYPSGARTDLVGVKNTFMDDDMIYHSYADTVYFGGLVANTLNTTGANTTSATVSVPIKPAYKVVDDEHVIGILTVADQFIMFSQPIELSSANDDIPILRQSGRIGAEAVHRSPLDDRDTERIEHINKIKLETNFFLAYRNTVRILLNDYANLALRTEIEAQLKNTFMLYSKKLESVAAILHRLIGGAVRFDDSMDPSLIQHVSVCLNNLPQQCAEANPVCVTDQASSTDDNGSGSVCTLVIPRFNLVSPNVSNETVYISKMADQLIRYARIRAYMLDTTQFLSFGDAQYNLGDNEFVVAQTVLKNEYFNNLVPQKTDASGHVSNYDNTNPDKNHSMEHVDTFKETDVMALSEDQEPVQLNASNVVKPVKLKINKKLQSEDA